MSASASDARTYQEVDDVDDGIPPSPLSQRVEDEASLPPAIAAPESLIVEQAIIDDRGQAVTKSPLGVDNKLMTTSSLTVATRNAKRPNGASIRHAGCSARSRNIQRA